VPSDYDPNESTPIPQPFGPPLGRCRAPNKASMKIPLLLDSFAPRFGFAWHRKQQSRLAVRGGYGWFYQISSDRGMRPVLLSQYATLQN